MLVLLISYILVASCLPIMSHRATLALHFAHACAWCIFHSFGLGLLLRAQSQSKFLVRHFLKNYPYPVNDKGDGAVQEAFTNWKSLYNMSLCMTYSVYFLCPVLFWSLISFLQFPSLALPGRPMNYRDRGRKEMIFCAIRWERYAVQFYSCIFFCSFPEVADRPSRLGGHGVV